jgi:hypothetical protein
MSFVTGLLIGAVAGALVYDNYLYKTAVKNGETKSFGIWQTKVKPVNQKQ